MLKITVFDGPGRSWGAQHLFTSLSPLSSPACLSFIFTPQASSASPPKAPLGPLLPLFLLIRLSSPHSQFSELLHSRALFKVLCTKGDLI